MVVFPHGIDFKIVESGNAEWPVSKKSQALVPILLPMTREHRGDWISP